MKQRNGRVSPLSLLLMVLLGWPPVTVAQPAKRDVFDPLLVEGEARCGHLVVRLAFPFLVVGHFPDTPTRTFYLILKSGRPPAKGLSGASSRESADYPRKSAPWLEGVEYIGDIPGFQLVLIELAEPYLVKLLPQEEPRAAAVLVTTPEAERECMARYNKQPK